MIHPKPRPRCALRLGLRTERRIPDGAPAGGVNGAAPGETIVRSAAMWRRFPPGNEDPFTSGAAQSIKIVLRYFPVGGREKKFMSIRDEA